MVKTIRCQHYAVSNQVLQARFDKNWRRTFADGHVVYTATSNHSIVKVLIRGGKRRVLLFKKGKNIIVVGGTFHGSPHAQILKNGNRINLCI